MENNAKFESGPEFNISRLLLHICLKWRPILLVTLISTLVLGSAKLALDILSINDQAKLDKRKTEYDVALALYQTTGRQLELSIEKNESLLKSQTDYNENSILMRIDQYNEWNGSLNLYVETDYQIMPGTSIQNENPAYRIAYAYSDYTKSGDFFSALEKNLSFPISDTKYLKEILAISVDGDRYAITIRAVADTESHCSEILDSVKKLIYDQQKEIGRQLGEHNLVAMNAMVYSQINTARGEYQLQQSEIESTLKFDLSNLRNEYLEWQKKGNQLTSPVLDTDQAVKGSIKFALIIAFVTFVLMCVLFCLMVLFSGKVQSSDDFPADLPVLGEIPARSEKRINPLDRLFFSLFGITVKRTEHDSRLEASALYIGQLVGQLPQSSKNTIAFVGDLPVEELQPLAKAMTKASSGHYTIVPAGNILISPEAGKITASAAAAVLVSKQGVSDKKPLHSMIKQLKSSGKPLLGVLVTNVDAR